MFCSLVGLDRSIPKLKELKGAGLTIRAITHNPNERKAPVSEQIQKGYAELVTLLGLNNVTRSTGSRKGSNC